MARPVKQPVNLGTITKPSGLSDGASLEWDRLVGELEKAGVLLTVAHRAALTLAATIAADIKEDWEVIQTDGAYLTSQKTGAVQAHPAVKRMDALRRDYLKALSMLGVRAATSGANPSSGETLDDILNG